MPLKNSQYDEIMREYYRRQLKNRHDQMDRVQEAYKKVPQLAKVDEEIAALSVQKAREALSGKDAALLTLRDEIQKLGQKRSALLRENGFPEDYLAIRYTCPDCQDTGYIGNQKCHCFRQAAIDLLYTQSNIKEALKTENFDTFSFEYYSDELIDPATGLSSLTYMKKLVAECREFIEDFDQNFENFFFYGATGVGKTFLSHCIARELIHSSHSVIYFSAFELFDLLGKTTFQRGEVDTAEADMYSYIFDCDLLIIDDLGTELTNAFMASQLFLCINERLSRKKSTLISTNLSLNVFRDTYSERVFSRITSNYKLRRLFGDDIRLLKKIKG